jgi:hypothetical protein
MFFFGFEFAARSILQVLPRICTWPHAFLTCHEHGSDHSKDRTLVDGLNSFNLTNESKLRWSLENAFT